MKSCKKQTNKSPRRILDDVDIIAQCMKFSFQMDTVNTRVPFVHASFKAVAHFCRSHTIPSVSTTNVNRRTHIIHYVSITFIFCIFEYCNNISLYHSS